MMACTMAKKQIYDIKYADATFQVQRSKMNLEKVKMSYPIAFSKNVKKRNKCFSMLSKELLLLTTRLSSSKLYVNSCETLMFMKR